MGVDVTRIAQDIIDTLLNAEVKTEEKELLRQGAIVGVNLLYEALRQEFLDNGGEEEGEQDYGPAN